jgi:uncharacterized protein YegJ (DUF2314 family)
VVHSLWKRNEGGLFETSGRSADESDEGEDEPLVSLVHLRSSERYLEAAVLVAALAQVWGLRISADDDEMENADGFVVGSNPMFIVVVRHPVVANFLVHNRDEAYFDDQEALADRLPNLRFARVIREHSAWLSVDLLNRGASEESQEQAYQLIGKAISALADDDTMGIYCPQSRRFNLWDQTLEQALCGSEPLSAFLEEVEAPVIAVKNTGDIERAMEEARVRWPEFVEAFAKREKDGPPFIVKARFISGEETEHMWIEAFGLEPEYVHGHLLNDPCYHPTLKKGSQVEVPVAEVSDWVFLREDGPVGNFTANVVAQCSRGERA